jgi:hypothetical protein
VATRRSTSTTVQSRVGDLEAAADLVEVEPWVISGGFVGDVPGGVSFGSPRYGGRVPGDVLEIQVGADDGQAARRSERSVGQEVGRIRRSFPLPVGPVAKSMGAVPVPACIQRRETLPDDGASLDAVR